MAYDSAKYQVKKTLTCPIEADLTTAAEIADFDLSENIEITEIGFICSTTVAADTTAPVVDILNGTGGTSVVSVTIPDTTSASDYVKSSVSNEDLNSGNTLVFNVATAAVDGGTAAGNGYIVIKYKENWK